MVWAETTPAAVDKSTFPMFIGRPLLTDQKGPNHAFIVTAHLTIQARNTTPCAAVTFNRNGRSRSPEYALGNTLSDDGLQGLSAAVALA